MAYLTIITRFCATCGNKASQQLFNHVNAPLGFYCARCGKRALAYQQASEQEMFERQRQANSQDAMPAMENR